MNCVVYDKLLFPGRCGEDGHGYNLLENLYRPRLLGRPWHILEHKMLLKNLDVRMQTGFILLRTGSSDKLLLTR